MTHSLPGPVGEWPEGEVECSEEERGSQALGDQRPVRDWKEFFLLGREEEGGTHSGSGAAWRGLRWPLGGQPQARGGEGSQAAALNYSPWNGLFPPTPVRPLMENSQQSQSADPWGNRGLGHERSGPETVCGGLCPAYIFSGPLGRELMPQASLRASEKRPVGDFQSTRSGSQPVPCFRTAQKGS